jgi:hypothetical protein
VAEPDDDHVCFELDGARVHGDPDMPPEVMAALRTVIAAATAQLEANPDPERDARYEAGQQRIRERNARILGREAP